MLHQHQEFVNKDYNMSSIIKIVFLHVIIAVIYITILTFYFVIYKHPDPIGSGFRLFMCFVLHLIVTSVVCKKEDLAVHMLVIFLIIGIYTLLDPVISRGAWNLRHQYFNQSY